MQAHEISKTAFLVAAYRARATNAETAVCYDPWAGRLAGDVGYELSEWYDGVLPDTELWVALRTRHIDDCVRSAIARGARQVVVLGAGLDTRAARLGQHGVRFFEVDRPASQAAKRAGLASLSGYPIDAATYVKCDFNQDCFVEQLSAAGFDWREPACFVIEGVLYYLPESAVRETLTKIASRCAPDSCVVFDHFALDEPSPSDTRFDVDAAKENLNALGETLLFGFDDADPLLSECGFHFASATSFADLALKHTGECDPVLGFDDQWITVASPGKPLH